MEALGYSAVTFLERVKHLFQPKPVLPVGYRVLEGWIVAEGDCAVGLALMVNPWPAEILTTAQLTGRYGGQIAIGGEGLFLFLPEGMPIVVSKIAIAAGFTEMAPGHPFDGFDYQAWWWSSDR